MRCSKISKEIAINEEIRVKEVRLISETGEQLGIVTSKEAKELASSKNLDLAMISPNAKPPVCKIMDYGKYKYEQARKEKEAKETVKNGIIMSAGLAAKAKDHFKKD